MVFSGRALLLLACLMSSEPEAEGARVVLESTGAVVDDADEDEPISAIFSVKRRAEGWVVKAFVGENDGCRRQREKGKVKGEVWTG